MTLYIRLVPESASAAHLFKMDELSALFCEDAEADGIQEVVCDAAFDTATAYSSAEPESTSDGDTAQESTPILGDDQGWVSPLFSNGSNHQSIQYAKGLYTPQKNTWPH